MKAQEKMAKSSSMSLLLFNILLYMVLGECQIPLAPALYVFGDSVVDSGNNNFLVTLAKANYLPYGIDFPAGVTGRFTNGKTVADFAAESLGLPLAPPFLGLSDDQRSKILTGVNYASGSAGILQETGSAVGRNLYMAKQVDLFRGTVQTDLPKNFKSADELSKYLSKSIFLVHTGGNDYINNYLVPAVYNSSRLYSPEQFAELLVKELGNHLKELYNLGARKIVVFGIPPLGCSLLCVDDINNLVLIYNDKLSGKLQELNSTLNGSTFVDAQTYELIFDMGVNPLKYGLAVNKAPCCVVGPIACVPNLKPCPDTKIRLLWDSVHPTEAVHNIIATNSFNGSSVSSPINIRQLAQRL